MIGEKCAVDVGRARRLSDRVGVASPVGEWGPTRFPSGDGALAGPDRPSCTACNMAVTLGRPMAGGWLTEGQSSKVKARPARAAPGPKAVGAGQR